MPVVTTNSPTPSEAARPSFVRRMTGIAAPTLTKAVDAGWIPDLSILTVTQLAQCPILISACTPDGAPIPALRMGVRTPEDPSEDADLLLPDWIVRRQSSGLSEDYSDEEFFAATHRWWKNSGRHRIADAGYLIVIIGGIVVGLLRITGEPIEHPRYERLAYPGYLVARLDRNFEILTPEDDRITEDDLELARDMLGTLSPTRGGGTINLLDGDLDNAS
ncbi:MAG: hypothetical protein QM809_18320 [Gordonia sp. (in: high G+C Gram-positive bacteria)]|uniref:hypothetical protein n=1 Tax=Gordonia sp. (in: high G+C Gram-positive bacteria) TaxID=84139 RepID=UPI0039E57811